jgi:hypothetical protein
MVITLGLPGSLQDDIGYLLCAGRYPALEFGSRQPDSVGAFQRPHVLRLVGIVGRGGRDAFGDCCGHRMTP